MIDPLRSLPLYIQIAQDIREQVNSGKLKEGDSIGTLNELGQKYNTSLITIRKAISELKFEKVLIGRMGKGTYVAPVLKSNGTPRVVNHKTIGFILKNLTTHFFPDILAGAESRIHETDYRLIVSGSAGKIEGEEDAIRHMLDLGVSGIIIASLTRDYDASRLISLLGQNDFPYVFVSYVKDMNVNYIGTDHKYIGYMATKHLLDIGYEKIGYINSEKGNVIGELRYKGYLNALKTIGMEPETDHLYFTPMGGDTYYRNSGYELGKKIASQKNRPRAYFIYNDLIALGFMDALLEKGLRIPEDVALIGVDDIAESETAKVPLTTIHQPRVEIGATAIETVIKLAEKKAVPARQLFKPSIVIRQSCGMGA